MNGKGKKKNEPPMEKEQSDEPLGSRRSKNNGKGKIICSYCGRGFHLESTCMRRTTDEMSLLLKKHNITLPTSTKKANHREEIE